MSEKNCISVRTFNQIISIPIENAMKNSHTWHFRLNKAAKPQKKMFEILKITIMTSSFCK